MMTQVNIWFALSGSVVGAYIASMFKHRKFSAFDVVFASVTVNILLYREE